VVVRDLMGCFLIPGIDRAKLKRQIRAKQKRFKHAAKDILKGVVDSEQLK
jgi:hypothetical protein